MNQKKNHEISKIRNSPRSSLEPGKTILTPLTIRVLLLTLIINAENP